MPRPRFGLLPVIFLLFVAELCPLIDVRSVSLELAKLAFLHREKSAVGGLQSDSQSILVFYGKMVSKI